jgi:ElaB/YqjD/DUF883 family membrane-anchored ribosome-binding protein
MSDDATRNRETSADEPRTEEQAAAASGGPEAESRSVGKEAQRSQEELRQDIEETREDLGDTVDALSQKADVKSQMQQAVGDQKDKLRAKQEEIKQKVAGASGGAGGDAGARAKDLMSQVAERASSQPLPYLGGAAAVGLVVGLALRGRRS